MSQLIEEIPCTDALELLSKLSPHHDLWRSTGGSTCWIFRGQSDAAWNLTPSAMRPDAFVHYGIGVRSTKSPLTAQEQVAEEANAIARFVRACVLAGRALPEDGQWLRSESLQRQVFNRQIFDDLRKGIEVPFPLQRSLYALAQHHGVPTRFLDWTGSATIASYFACEAIARHQADPEVHPRAPTGTHLSVWAIRSFIAFRDIAEWASRTGFDPVLDLVEAPYADNPRLAAQRGAFTLVVHKKEPVAPKLATVVDVIESYGKTKYGGLRGEPDVQVLLRKFTLPHTEARRLLRELAQAGVHAGTTYPDYDGAVKSVEECRFWM